MCVVDWFSNMYVPWIPAAQMYGKLSFPLKPGSSKSITALVDCLFSASNSYHHPLSCFSMNIRVIVKQSEVCSTLILIIMLLECQMQFS